MHDVVQDAYDAALRRLRRLSAYYRRIHAPRSPLSSRHRAGSRANRSRRTVPTFASDRRGKP